MLDEFYYKYNNRVNKSTKPLTPYQRFYKRPNFCVALEDQVPLCNLTSEEKAFLDNAHLDVDDNVETEELTEENTAVIENSQQKERKITEQDDLNGEVNGELIIVNQKTPLDTRTEENSSSFDNPKQTEQVNANDNSARPVCAHDDESSREPVPVRQLTNKEYMENMWRQKLEIIVPVERSSHVYNATPLADITNTQMVRNTDLMQAEVSPYYRDMYAKRFLPNVKQTNSTGVLNKRRYSESSIYTTENRETWDKELYPVELFPKKSQVMEMQTFNPNINDTIDFRPN